jgi:hypothetical protein
MIGNQANALLGSGSCAPDRASRSAPRLRARGWTIFLESATLPLASGAERGVAKQGPKTKRKAENRLQSTIPCWRMSLRTCVAPVATRLRHARVVSTRPRSAGRDRLRASAGGVGPVACFVAEQRQEGSGPVQRHPAQVAGTDGRQCRSPPGGEDRRCRKAFLKSPALSSMSGLIPLVAHSDRDVCEVAHTVG